MNLMFAHCYYLDLRFDKIRQHVVLCPLYARQDQPFLEFIIPVDLITMPHGKKNKKQHTLNVQPQEVNNEMKPAFSVSVALSFCLIN